MAIRYAVASGNWSSTSTWDGGTLPASTDDVYSNNFTVSIDQTITVASLKKISNGSPAITAGGQFVVTTAATVTITAGIAAADNVTNSSYLLAVNAGTANVTISTPTIVNGNGLGRNAVELLSGYTGTCTVNANIAPAGNNTTSYAIRHAANNGALVVNGSVSGSAAGGGGTTVGILISGSGAIATITGNVTGGAGAAMYAIQQDGAAAQLFVNGTVRGGSVSAGINILGGAAKIRGTLRPGTQSTGSLAVITGSAGILVFSGDVYSGGMVASSGPNGFFPISGNWGSIDGEEIRLHIFDDSNYPSGLNGGSQILTRYGSSNPVEADVRDGITYGVSGQLTGTLAVPPASSVANGVPVDDTTGTAALNLSDLAAVTGAQIAAATTA